METGLNMYLGKKERYAEKRETDLYLNSVN
jgi:hypothetical protein